MRDELNLQPISVYTINRGWKRSCRKRVPDDGAATSLVLGCGTSMSWRSAERRCDDQRCQRPARRRLWSNSDHWPLTMWPVTSDEGTVKAVNGRLHSIRPCEIFDRKLKDSRFCACAQRTANIDDLALTQLVICIIICRLHQQVNL